MSGVGGVSATFDLRVLMPVELLNLNNILESRINLWALLYIMSNLLTSLLTTIEGCKVLIRHSKCIF